MATFVLLTRLTDKGADTIARDPERIREVSKELEGMGARVSSEWAVLGPYDFVNIVEAPDSETIARASAQLTSMGSVRVTALSAMTIDQYIRALK